MCTLADGMRLAEVFLEYHDGKPIENEDKELLDRLVMASYIDYVLKDGKAYAQASQIAKGLGELLHDALIISNPAYAQTKKDHGRVV